MARDRPRADPDGAVEPGMATVPRGELTERRGRASLGIVSLYTSVGCRDPTDEFTAKTAEIGVLPGYYRDTLPMGCFRFAPTSSIGSVGGFAVQWVLEIPSSSRDSASLR